VVLFDVKQFQATEDDFKPGGGSYDPYKPTREKIHAARKKFQGLKKYPCCLVLYNREKPLVDLEWRYIYGAMLGNLSIQMPFDKRRGELIPEKARTVFGSNGKVTRKVGQHFLLQNQTISTVIVLEQLPIGQQRFNLRMKQFERDEKRRIPLEEFWERIQQAQGTEEDVSVRQLRVVVNENPYCRMPLTESIFRGPYDERYGADKEGRIIRKFAGEQIQRIEAEEKSLK